jgi:hypothetical protein
MRNLFVAVLLASSVASIGVANAADGCGPGCHQTSQGQCVVDGWGTGTPTWNECPAGARPRPPAEEAISGARVTGLVSSAEGRGPSANPAERRPPASLADEPWLQIREPRPIRP